MKQVIEANYTISFIPYIIEPKFDEDDNYQCSSEQDNFGERIQQYYIPNEKYGKKFNFDFTVGHCFPSCSKCKKIGTEIMSQECDLCIPKFYFLEFIYSKTYWIYLLSHNLIF